MPLAAGTRLGPYEIVGPLGAGGMGEVYRGRDTRLGRTVAIKVLRPAASTTDRRRLLREARIISTLSDPHICSLFDVGSDDDRDFLVMEYLDGESLAQRLSRGPLPLREALTIAAQTAKALGCAHAAGIVHRDLKPGNVMLTKSGAKLLDFGLSRIDEASAVVDATTQARGPLTLPGTVVGTLNYMSPEQLRGAPADARSDIFALGCVLFEMLTGLRPFDAPSRLTLTTNILEEDVPPVSSIVSVPAAVDRVVGRCLEKNPDHRWQNAFDLADELEWLAGGSTATAAVVRPLFSKRNRLLPLLMIAALIAAIAWWAALRRPAPVPAHDVAFAVDPPPGTRFLSRAVISELAVSPDGQSIVLVASRAGKRMLYLRQLNDFAEREMAGTEGAVSPFWSPDQKWIGFFADGNLKKIRAAGGPAGRICRAQGGSGSWNSRGEILFAEWGNDTSGAVQMISADGGAVRKVTPEDGWYLWPVFLPDGVHFLCFGNFGLDRRTGLYAGSTGEKGLRLIAPIRSRAEVSRHGEIFYAREGALVRQSFDLGTQRLSGDPILVSSNVFAFAGTGVANFSTSRDGRVVATLTSPPPTRLVWKNRGGHTDAMQLAPTVLRSFALSPNGKRIAYDEADKSGQATDLWLHDVERGVSTRVTSNRLSVAQPVWNGDGEVIVAAIDPRHPSDAPQLCRIALADGRLHFLSESDGIQYPTDIVRSTGQILFTVDRGKSADVEMLPIAGGRKTPVIASAFDERDAVLSPDERWIAFTSDESGQPETYIAPFLRAGEHVRVSTAGGVEPRWRPEGGELYFLNPDGVLMGVAVTGEVEARVGTPTPLFPINSAHVLDFAEFGAAHYQPAPGGRFLVRELPEDADHAQLVVHVRAE